MGKKSIYGVKIYVSDIKKTAEWLCQNLFFIRESQDREWILKSGNFRIILVEKCKDRENLKYNEAMYLGISHIALETENIEKAISYCKSKKLQLELGVNGEAMHNDKVYGTGMNYFNIVTEYGFTIEISQKIHVFGKKKQKNIINGLEHIGLQTNNIMQSLKFYEDLGFKRAFEPVCNEKDGHQIYCCIVTSGGTSIELYEFHDIPNLAPPAACILDTLIIENKGSQKKIQKIKGPMEEKLEIFNDKFLKEQMV